MTCYLIKVGYPCSLAFDPPLLRSQTQEQGQSFLMLPFLCGQENLSTLRLLDYIGLTCIIQDQSLILGHNLEYFHLLKSAFV